MVGKVSIKTYPVFEKHSLIFVFIGDMDPPPPIEEDVQPIFWNPNLYVRPLTRNKLRCNWRLAAENGIDQGHLYLHRNWAFAERYGCSYPCNAVKSKDEVVVLDEPGGPKVSMVRARS